MIVKQIKLTNFRCHTTYQFNFNEQTSLILGKNGCGKTSILEAIYIALQGKSFRAVDHEIIKNNTKFYRIEIFFNNGEKYIVTYDNEKKKFLIADKISLRIPKKNKYPIVLFEPDDLNLIGSSPTKKRSYFDRFFSQFNEKYHTSLLRYDKALKQRNELMKNDFVQPELAFSWNILLAEYGSELISCRHEYINKINNNLTTIYRSIANNNDTIEIKHLTNIENINKEQYVDILNKNFEKDHLLGRTTFGAHQDNYNFWFNNKLADGSASRGEVRSLILALKFIEAKILDEQLKTKPLILLDDVFSELDKTRQECLVTNFKDNQIILTSVEDPDFCHLDLS